VEPKHGDFLLLGPGAVRAMFGAATWLLLVLIPWLAVAVMFSLLVPQLLALAVVCLAVYVVLTVEAAGPLDYARALGALLLVAGVVATEWFAGVTAEHVARQMVAESRGRELHLGVIEPMASALLAAAVFLLGRRLVAKDGDGAATVGETLGVALVCPAAAFLVSLNRLPLST
jgi:hypothetical protein